MDGDEAVENDDENSEAVMRQRVGKRLKAEAKLWRSSALPGLTVIAAVVLARLVGWLQPLEWMALDRFLLLRPDEPMDERIVIIGIEEADIRQLHTYPVPDREIAQLVTQLQPYQPVAIGLDIFRDFPIGPGHVELTRVFQTTANLFAIERVSVDPPEAIVKPPAAVPPERVGFADIVLDADGYVRRSLLGMADPHNPQGDYKFSLTARLADAYLRATHNLELESIPDDPYGMRFGATHLPRFFPHTGSYVGVDAGGNQVLLNSRRSQRPFRMVSLMDMKAQRFNPDWFRGRIVLIGITAQSVKDVVNSAAIPSRNPGLVNGVELQAHAVSQLLSAVLDGRPLLRTWEDGWEYLWIVAWGVVGLGLGRWLRSPWKILLMVGLVGVGLGGLSYGLLLLGWWVPVVPALMGLVFNGTGLTAALFYRYEQEIRARLKDRQQVIDQTFDAIHNGPLQQLAKLLREVQDNAAVPRPVVAELHLLNQNLRAVYDSIQQETLNADRLALTRDLDMDLQTPLLELLQMVYDTTFSRDFPGFRSVSVVVPQWGEMDDRNLTQEQKRSLCRFLEEALCNVGKHAIAATKLWVFCGQEDSYQVIRVKDNGSGPLIAIETAESSHRNRTAGMGTRQAISLAKQLRGQFQRLPNTPQGTICELVWPIAKSGLWP